MLSRWLIALHKNHQAILSLCIQTPKQPGGLWGVLLSGLLRWAVYAAFFWAMVLVGSAALRRAAAMQSAAANSMSGVAAAPSLPGPGSAAGYAPKEYIKVRSDGETQILER